MKFYLFYLVFCVRKAIFILVFLKILVIRLTSLPQYANVAYIFLWCWGSVCMFCFVVVEVIFRLRLCYMRYFVVIFLIVFIYVGFAFWLFHML
jgi:hypothetical protein